MNEVYVLIKHENTIDNDLVEVVMGSKELSKIEVKFKELVKKYEKKYSLMMKNYIYASFTNENDEYLIELMIEKVNLN